MIYMQSVLRITFMRLAAEIHSSGFERVRLSMHN